MQELIENYYKLQTIDNFISWFSVNEKRLLEKEKEQAIGLIDQTAMFMSVVTQDEDVAKMDFEDVYNSYYNQNK